MLRANEEAKILWGEEEKTVDGKQTGDTCTETKQWRKLKDDAAAKKYTRKCYKYYSIKNVSNEFVS